VSWELLDGRTITLTSIVLFVAQLLGVLSMLHAIRSVRTPQGAIAWCVGLLTLPIVVVPLYWIFGRSRFFGYREALRRALREQRGPATEYGNFLSRVVDPRKGVVLPLHEVARVVGQNVTFGNRLEPLVDGDATFAELFAAIGRAEHYVLVQFYIIRDDSLGDEFAHLLMQRAREGIQVRLLYDDIGCQWLPQRYLDALRDAGVMVCSFNTRERWRQRLQINFRNHRKVLVVDGKVGFTGGLNIGDEYRGRSSDFRHWRDTHVRVTGPAVLGLQSAFSQDWFWGCHEILTDLRWNPHLEEPVAAIGICPEDPSGQALVIPTGPADQFQQCAMMFCQMAAVAKRRLWIATPYLVPDDAVSVALQSASRRGVEVVVLIPRNGDHWFTHLAGFHYAEQYSLLGIRVMRYERGFMHQKVILVDDQIAAIGSTNLDQRSLHLNFELMLASSDPEFLCRVQEMLETDLRRSQRVASDELDKRSWLFRLGVGVTRLFAPIL